MLARKISLGIAMCYLIVALIFGGWQLLLMCAVLVLIPLAMIWFPEVFSEYIGGFHRIGGPYITKKSPGSLIVLFGWFLLLVPLVVLIIKL